VLRVEAVAKGMADDLVGQHTIVPCLGQAEQALVTAGRLVHAVHRGIIT